MAEKSKIVLNAASIIIVLVIQLGLLLPAIFGQAGNLIVRFIFCFIFSFFIFAVFPKLRSANFPNIFYSIFLLAINICIVFTYFVHTNNPQVWLTIGFIFLLLLLSKKQVLLKILFLVLWTYLGFLTLNFQTFSFLGTKGVLYLYGLCTLSAFLPMIFADSKTFYLRKMRLLSFVIMEISLIRLASVFVGADWHTTQKVLENPFIKPIVLYIEDNELSEVLREKPPRVAYEGCSDSELFLFGSGIIKINRKTKNILGVFSGTGFGDTAFIKCEGKEPLLYFPAYSNHQLLIFNTKNIKGPIQSLPLPEKCQPDHVLVDGGNKRIFVACDTFAVGDAGNLLILEKNSGKLIGTVRKKLTVPRFYDKSSLVFQADGKIYLFNYIKNELRELPFYRGTGRIYVDVDPIKGTIFSSNPSGDLRFLDAAQAEKQTLRDDSEIYLEPFIRYIRFDENRHLLFVAGYLNGNIYVIDTTTRKILHKIFAGTKIRTMTFSRDFERLYFATNQGIFCLDLNKMRPLKKPGMEVAFDRINP